MQYSVPFRQFAAEVLDCRDCRLDGGSFAQAVGGIDRNPEIHDGPEEADILIVSINPRLWPNAAPVTGLDKFLDGSRLTRARERSSTLRSDRYVKAIEASLPPGYSWWGPGRAGVANTRMCKCPTQEWSAAFSEAAAHCAAKFLRRELALIRPKVLVVLGVDSWQTVLPHLGIESVPTSPGPHLLKSRVSIIAAHHLTRKSNEYRAEVRRLITAALQ